MSYFKTLSWVTSTQCIEESEDGKDKGLGVGWRAGELGQGAQHVLSRKIVPRRGPERDVKERLVRKGGCLRWLWFCSCFFFQPKESRESVRNLKHNYHGHLTPSFRRFCVHSLLTAPLKVTVMPLLIQLKSHVHHLSVNLPEVVPCPGSLL